jgi:selenocysteine-specific elongation factor
MSAAKRSLPFIIATAGHVDHGKSAVVKTLTQTDPDRLPEEKKRGITIDLGFAQWILQDPENPSVEYDLGMVDVPGHEDFVKNMVTGVGAIDLGLLVIAADDGWMPQTEEHFQILEYLDVPDLVIVMTKADLADADAEFVIEMIREEIQDTRFETAPIVATSTKTGEGFDQLGAIVAERLRPLGSRTDLGKPRLPVDRAFTVKGMGTIVTGALTGSSFKADQAVCVQPGNIQTKIRSIQHHHAQQDSAQPGMRIALNLSGLSVRQGHETANTSIGRGQVVTIPELGTETDCFDAVVSRSQRLLKPGKHPSGPLKSGTRIRVHLGSNNVPGRIEFSNHAPLLPGNISPARIKLERPVFALEGDRFVIRDWSQQGTIAGGRIWDASSSHVSFKSKSQQNYLNNLCSHQTDVGEYLASRLERDGGVQLDALHQKCHWTAKQLAREAAKLVKEKKGIKRAEWLLDNNGWNTALEDFARQVEDYHQQHPDMPGFPIETARKILGKNLPSLDLWSAALTELGKSLGIEQAGEHLCHQSHSVTLPDRLQSLAKSILKTLSESPNEPPARKHLDTSQDTGDTIRCLIRMKKVTEIGPDLIVLSDAYDNMVRCIQATIKQQGPSTVSALRQELGVSRRIAIPLLEKLDKEGRTIREGDFRNWK